MTWLNCEPVTAAGRGKSHDALAHASERGFLQLAMQTAAKQTAPMVAYTQSKSVYTKQISESLSLIN
jgi:hypothetical protein